MRLRDCNVKYDIVPFQVKFERVVNIVEKRNPMPLLGLEYDRDFHDDQWYGCSRSYQDARECYAEASYPPYDFRYFDENPDYGSVRRNSSPPRNVRKAWFKLYELNSVLLKV